MTKQMNRYFLFVFLYFFMASVCLSMLMRFWGLPSWAFTFGMQFLIHVPLLIVFCVWKKCDLRKTFALYPIHWKDALLCIGIGFAVQPLMSMIIVLTSPLQENLADASLQSMYGDGLLPMLLVVAVQPALFEELLFRGAALHGYMHRGMKPAILISAFLFGLLHMNLQQALYAFCIGIVFAFLVQRTGSILASMLPHFVINAYNCILSYAMMHIPITEPVEEYSYSMLEQFMGVGMQCIIALPFLLVFGFYFMRRHPDEALEDSVGVIEPPKERFFTLSMIGIILFFLLFGVLPTLSIFS